MTATPFSAVMGILGQRLVQALMVALLVAGLCFLMVQSLPGGPRLSHRRGPLWL